MLEVLVVLVLVLVLVLVSVVVCVGVCVCVCVCVWGGGGGGGASFTVTQRFTWNCVYLVIVLLKLNVIHFTDVHFTVSESKGKSHPLNYWPLIRESIDQWQVDSHYKGPIRRKRSHVVTSSCVRYCNRETRDSLQGRVIDWAWLKAIIPSDNGRWSAAVDFPLFWSGRQFIIYWMAGPTIYWPIDYKTYNDVYFVSINVWKV